MIDGGYPLILLRWLR